MDSEGYIAGIRPRMPTHVPASLHVQNARVPGMPSHDITTLRGAALGGRAAVQPKLSSEEKMANRADRVQSWINFPLMGQLALLPAFLMRKMSFGNARMHRMAAYPRMIGQVGFAAQGDVSIANLTKMPAHAVNVMADQLAIGGHSIEAVTKMRGRAQVVQGHMDKMQTSVFTPAGKKLSNAIDSVAAGKTSGPFHGALNWFAKKRAAANLAKSDGVGLAKKIAEAASEYGYGFSTMPVKSLDMVGPANRAAHFYDVAAQSRAIMPKIGVGKPALAAEEISRLAMRQAKYAEAAMAHGSAVGGDLAKLSKNFLKSTGRVSVLTAGMTVAAAMATTSAYYLSKHSKRSKNLVQEEIRNNLGVDKNHPLLREIQHQLKQENHGQWMATGFTGVTETAMAATMNSTGMGAGAMVPFAMFGGKIKTALVSESPFEKAYTGLKKMERGELPKDPAQIRENVRHMVGTAIEASMREAYAPKAANENHVTGKAPFKPMKVSTGLGYYNNLNVPLTDKILAMNLGANETVKLLGDSKKFTALAVEAKNEKDLAKAQTPGHSEPTRETSANNNETRYHAAAKPTRVVANDVHHQGRVASAHAQGAKL